MILIFVWIVIVILFMLVSYFAIKSIFGKEEMVDITTKEGFTFRVNKRTDANAAADILLEMHKRVVKLIDHLQIKDPAKHLILKREYDPDDFVENPDETFVIGKGVKIHLCIRNPDHSFYTVNQLMFVVIHELAHIVTNSYYHTPLFWMNNIYLLHLGAEAGVYSMEDYSMSPFVYCNDITVDSNPAMDLGFQERLKYADPDKDLVSM